MYTPTHFLRPRPFAKAELSRGHDREPRRLTNGFSVETSAQVGVRWLVAQAAIASYARIRRHRYLREGAHRDYRAVIDLARRVANGDRIILTPEKRLFSEVRTC